MADGGQPVKTSSVCFTASAYAKGTAHVEPVANGVGITAVTLVRSFGGFSDTKREQPSSCVLATPLAALVLGRLTGTLGTGASTRSRDEVFA